MSEHESKNVSEVSRRDFLAGSAATAGGLLLPTAAAQAADPPSE